MSRVALHREAGVEAQRRGDQMNVVLSYGLGVDSTALLLRWPEEPDSRNFQLNELLVVTSMIGDEWPTHRSSGRAACLPRLREAGVRFAQVARAGRRQADGIDRMRAW